MQGDLLNVVEYRADPMDGVQIYDAMKWSEEGIIPMFDEDCPANFRPAGEKRI